MRAIIHDQVSHTYIEGPLQPMSVNTSFQEAADKAANHAGLNQENIIKADDNDLDIPAYEVNERNGFRYWVTCRGKK